MAMTISFSFGAERKTGMTMPFCIVEGKGKVIVIWRGCEKEGANVLLTSHHLVRSKVAMTRFCLLWYRKKDGDGKAFLPFGMGRDMVIATWEGKWKELGPWSTSLRL